MKIGYINRYDLKNNPHLTDKFKFMEASATRTINSRGDKAMNCMIRSRLLWEVLSNA